MTRIVAIILLALAAFGCAYKALTFYGSVRYAAGQSEVQGRWNSANRAAEAVAARAAAENQLVDAGRKETVHVAETAAAGRSTVNRGAAADTRAELAGLRRDLAAATAARGGLVPGDALAACTKDLATRDAVLQNLADAGAVVAEQADGHASDSLMLQEAWPKN